MGKNVILRTDVSGPVTSRGQCDAIRSKKVLAHVLMGIILRLRWLYSGLATVSIHRLLSHKVSSVKKNAIVLCPSGCVGPSSRFYQLILLFTVMLFAGIAANAQQGQVAWEGVVRRAAGAPIVHARIELTGNGAKAEATTGEDGRFIVTGIVTGQYHLSIEVAGKTTEYPQSVDVLAGGPPVVVTFSGRGEIAVAVAREKGQAATGGEQLSSQAVSELPLNKRDFSSLLLLAAGTMTDANGATNFTAQFAINGQRGVEATFAMDGRGHQRSGDGRRDLLELQRGCGRGHRFELGLAAGGDWARRFGVHQYPHAFGRERISRLVFRVCA